jgi:hypothetical protein
MRNDGRSRKAGRFIARVHKAIQNAVIRSGLKQNDIAIKLDLDRSIVNRRIQGQANLTLRTIADFAWALDHDIIFDLVPRAAGREVNRHDYEISPPKITISAVTDNIAASSPLPYAPGSTQNRKELTYAR